MTTSEKFCLRWNDFESNISVAFQELREDKDFFDVTLACDDNQIQAHKVILSACSSFFRSVLKKNRHEHPLLYLRGCKYTDIVNILNFMYFGEVNVSQEDLNTFLLVAEDLKVKGLTQHVETVLKADIQPKLQLHKFQSRGLVEKSDIQAPPPLKRARPTVGPTIPKFITNNEDNIEDVNHHIKTEPTSHDTSAISDTDSFIESNATLAGQSHDAGNYNEDYNDYGYDATASSSSDGNKGCDDIWSKLEKNGKIIRCRICGLNKHQDFFATLIAHIRKDHL